MTGGTKEVLVTGIRFTDEESRQERMGKLAVTKDGASFSAFPFIGESFSGTGDLFASVIAGGKRKRRQTDGYNDTGRRDDRAGNPDICKESCAEK